MRANLAVMMHPSDAADETHLSAEQILELVERGQRCARYDEYIDHITICPICRETYKQLLQAEAVVREARRSRFALPRLVAPLAAAAAVLAVVFVGRALLLPPAPTTLALRQQDGVWYEGATRLPEWASSAAALFANPPDLQTRSDSVPAERAVRLLAPNPANRALESLTPEFRWQAVPDAARYRARLQRVDTGSDQNNIGNPATATTGLEVAIPLSVLGNPQGEIKILAVLTGGADLGDPCRGTYLSNQSLPAMNIGDTSQQFPNAAWSRCPDPPFDSFPFSFVALAGTHYVSVQPCPAGDVNGDGCVDDADLLIVLFNFGNAGGQGDVNNDNIVDDADLLIVLFNFGAGC
jgi:hypothetical protein